MSFNQKYWRYSLFYFLYFSSLGALVPYWSVYLKSLSFSALEIGQLIATLAATKIFAPYIWGWVADKTGQHIRIVQITSVIACAFFIPLIWSNSYWGMMLFMVLFSFFWNAALPQFEVVTIANLGNDKHRYSQIRLWGSIGFIVTVFLVAWLLKLTSVDVLPVAVFVVMLLIVLSSYSVHEEPKVSHDSGSIINVLNKPEVIALLLACFFMQLSHGPYYTFFTLFMKEQNYSITMISSFWSLGVLAEVILFLFMHRLFKHGDATFFLFLSLVLTAIRWLLLSMYSDVLVVVLLIQCLHAASFGLFHASAIHLIDDYFPYHKGRGQAIYASVSFGAGGAFGSLYSGYLWEFYTPTVMFIVAGGVALLGAIVYRGLLGYADLTQQPSK
ncbi:MAG: MFS transporter [Gammaproteobacteria bacterium]|nr:MFS transporter [Gammaproteobacteria bacterium]